MYYWWDCYEWDFDEGLRFGIIVNSLKKNTFKFQKTLLLQKNIAFKENLKQDILTGNF